MKVLLTKPFFDTDLQYIAERIDAGIHIVTPSAFTPEAIAEAAADADVLFGGNLAEPILQAAKNLKLAQIPWTGVDNLNFDLLQKYNVTVANSHSNAVIVGEHGVAMMLDAAKKISYHDRQMRAGEWNRVKPTGNAVSPFSKMVIGSTVGFVGFGAIGQQLHKMLSGFGCHFKVFSRSGTPVSGYAADYFTVDNIQAELAGIDFLFLVLPLTPETRNIVDADFLSGMNEKAVLINLSRGELIDEEALYKALQDKSIGAAALDVWYNYPKAGEDKTFPSARNKFHELDNVTMSPHRAGYADSGFWHLDDAIDNLNNLHAGRLLKNVVSLNHKY
ncbi:2-hydroxyacid dehydrogenase [Flavobacterium longum]|uniref:2-hydroxyacid dehydrogenase n=1 Tax=Flavobacterium longum TaxID=1299340 RepID=UPI0039E7AC0B